MFKTKLSPVAPDGSRLPTVSLTVAFSAGAVSAVLLLACGGHTTTAAPSDPSTATAQTAEQHSEPVAAQSRPWLPTRTFDCPECGCAVPTNDNAPPILLLGFVGQGAFGLRFFVQWIASERARASVIPEVFWWLSIAGGVLLLLYGWALLAWPIIIGQGLNCLIYGRNLVFIRAGKLATERENHERS